MSKVVRSDINTVRGVLNYGWNERKGSSLDFLTDLTLKKYTAENL